MKRRKMLLGLLYAAGCLQAVEPVDVAGRQIELCMIGDSIAWANNGDWFRKHLVAKLPNLAFVGSHTAKFGYSHAGEGGNRTNNVLARLDDVSNIPNSRYYHLMIGVNDSASARNEEQVEAVSKGTAERICKIVDGLLKRPTTEKVFLATIMPCSSDYGDKAKPDDVERMKYRDMAGSATNVILRRDAPAMFGNKVVIVEYERPIRAMDTRTKLIRLHPLPDGYAIVAGILAPVLKKEAQPANAPLGKFGVEVTNLWQNGCTAPLVPGWYVVSFDVKNMADEKVQFTLQTKQPEKYKTPYKNNFVLPGKPGERLQFEFMTGYEGYGYNKSPLEIVGINAEITNVMVEKMRPSRKASVYGTGTFVDSTSKMALGEKFVDCKQ